MKGTVISAATSNAVSSVVGCVVSGALSIYRNVECKVVGFVQGPRIP